MRLLPWLIPALCLFAGVGCEKKKSTQELIGDLKSSQERDRIIAVRTMPVKSDEAAVILPALIDALKDKQSDIRISAAIKIGLFGEQAREAIPALQAALKDRDARVRNAAATAISRIDPNVSQ